MSLCHQHTQREQRRTADSFPAMDQHTIAAPHLLLGEFDSTLQPLATGAHLIGGRKMEELDALARKQLRVVTILFAQVDDCADAVLACQLRGALHWEASADCEQLR